MDGISHLTFLVRDLDRMAKFICDGLGAVEIYDSNGKNFSLSREKFFVLGGVWIAAMEGIPPAERSYVSNTINVLKTPGNFVPSTSQPRVSCLALLPSKPEALHAATRRLSHDTESIERRRVSQRHCC